MALMLKQSAKLAVSGRRVVAARATSAAGKAEVVECE
jgi:hypothetical protein